MPPRINIEAYREKILDARHQGLSAAKILEFLNPEIIADGGSPVSLITLKRALAA